MSVASDKFENDVAKNIATITKYDKTSRPKVDTGYADVLISDGKSEAWLEVKMNHTDNLGNPRVFYKNGKWQTTYKTPLASYVVDLLNKSSEAEKFISKLSEFVNIPVKDIYLPTTKSDLKQKDAIPLNVLKHFVSQPGINRYVMSQDIGSKMGEIVTEHYTKGKTKPAYYLQAADDFYLISAKNPLKLSNGIPKFGGDGVMKVRISTRSEFYEIQAEVKVTRMNNSRYSIKQGTNKLNPFAL